MKFWMMVEKEAGFFFPSLTEECINTISILGLGSQGPGSSGGLAECKGAPWCSKRCRNLTKEDRQKRLGQEYRKKESHSLPLSGWLKPSIGFTCAFEIF